MSPWEKPNEKLVRLLDEIVATLEFDAPVDSRPMFGCPAYFTGGNLFAGVWQDTVMLRLSEDERAAGRGRRRAALRTHARQGDEGVRPLPPEMVADRGAGAPVGAQGGRLRRVAAAQGEEAAQARKQAGRAPSFAGRRLRGRATRGASPHRRDAVTPRCCRSSTTADEASNACSSPLGVGLAQSWAIRPRESCATTPRPRSAPASPYRCASGRGAGSRPRTARR